MKWLCERDRMNETWTSEPRPRQLNITGSFTANHWPESESQRFIFMLFDIWYLFLLMFGFLPKVWFSLWCHAVMFYFLFDICLFFVHLFRFVSLMCNGVIFSLMFTIYSLMFGILKSSLWWPFFLSSCLFILFDIFVFLSSGVWYFLYIFFLHLVFVIVLFDVFILSFCFFFFVVIFYYHFYVFKFSLMFFVVFFLWFLWFFFNLLGVLSSCFYDLFDVFNLFFGVFIFPLRFCPRVFISLWWSVFFLIFS